MKLRLGFSIALIAVLVGIWILLAKPTCVDGLRAAFAPHSGWTCVER
jgi:hypothetical protein